MLLSTNVRFLSVAITGVAMSSLGVLLLLIAGSPLLWDTMHYTPLGMAYMVYSIIVGGIICTCFSILTALWVKSHVGYTIVTTTLIYFMIPTLSPTFFLLIPELPDAMQTAFLFNPMTYCLNIIRDGMFDQVNAVTTNVGVVILAGSAGLAFYAAIRLMLRHLMRDSL
jgi:ABC-type polysaccharide/polyol phosphate export permease